MFAFGFKGRTGECLRRGAYALFLGDYANKNSIQALGLNEKAQADLFFLTNGICLHDLYRTLMASKAGTESWASIDFFMEHMLPGIEQFERERRMAKGTLAVQCIQALSKIGNQAQRHEPMGPAAITLMGAWLADEVMKLADDKNDEILAEQVEAVIIAARDRFGNDTRPMFA